MDRFKVIAIPVALFIWIGTTLLFVRFMLSFNTEFEQYYLDVVSNYASDAAVMSVVSTTYDLEADYAGVVSVQIDPDEALNEFVRMMCESLGYSYSVENQVLIKSQYIKAFCVTSNDGFYLAEPTQINANGAIDLVFRPKRPYTYTHENGRMYSLRLGDSYVSMEYNGKVQEVVSPLTTQETSRYINGLISKVMTDAVAKATEGASSTFVYLPGELTEIVKTNPIKGVTVLAYVKGVEMDATESYDSFAIGGSHVVFANQYVAYEKDGKKLYTHTKLYDGTGTVKQTYATAELAAAAGYSYDLSFYD
ncbi:MAG: hypothetical protein IKT62_02010 [Firmicutes bacterium]|nr:hypothetical protein [Bacillota bacterium]